MAVSHGYFVGDLRDEGDMSLCVRPAHHQMALHSNPFQGLKVFLEDYSFATPKYSHR